MEHQSESGRTDVGARGTGAAITLGESARGRIWSSTTWMRSVLIVLWAAWVAGVVGGILYFILGLLGYTSRISGMEIVGFVGGMGCVIPPMVSLTEAVKNTRFGMVNRDKEALAYGIEALGEGLKKVVVCPLETGAVLGLLDVWAHRDAVLALVRQEAQLTPAEGVRMAALAMLVVGAVIVWRKARAEKKEDL